MAAINKKNIDLELTIFRESLPTSPNIAEITASLCEQVQHIHVGFLFCNSGLALRRKLCLCLSGTKPSALYSGWKEFGLALKIEPELIECFVYNFQKDDPTDLILKACAQKTDFSLEKIVRALCDIKRCDVIMQTHDMFSEMTENISKNFKSDPTPDHVITPHFLPDCPFLLKDISRTNEGNKVEVLRHVRSEPTKRSKNKYAKTVLLTYSRDAIDLISQIAGTFRRSGFGVLILNEHSNIVNLNPEKFIHDSFLQVNYVVPIITKKYLDAVTQQADNCTDRNIDVNYAKYIYTLMNTHYLRNGCRNVKVRCLIPDDGVKFVQRHYIMTHSLLQVWCRFSEIDDMIESMLKCDL